MARDINLAAVREAQQTIDEAAVARGLILIGPAKEAPGRSARENG